MERTAVILYRGPAHVIEWCNDPLRSLVGWDPTGIPAREAFPGYDQEQALMDRVLRSGVDGERICHVDGQPGLFVVMPRLVDGQLVGVKSGWRPVRARRPVG